MCCHAKLKVHICTVFKVICVLYYCHVQVPLAEALKKSGDWPAWQPQWDTQQQRTLKYSEARVKGGTRVMSIEYEKSQTRNGTRVETELADAGGNMQPFAAEVLRIVELRPQALVDSSGCDRVIQFAVLQRFDTVVREDHAQLAQRLLEAELDSVQECSELDAVPLDRLHPLNACLVRRDGVSWLQFVRQLGRSKQHVFGMPA